MDLWHNGIGLVRPNDGLAIPNKFRVVAYTYQDADDIIVAVDVYVDFDDNTINTIQWKDFVTIIANVVDDNIVLSYSRRYWLDNHNGSIAIINDEMHINTDLYNQILDKIAALADCK